MGSDVLTTDNGSALIPEDLAGAEPIRPGIYLVKPHGRLIARGEKTLIVKSRAFTKYSGVPLYVVEGTGVWALISMKDPVPISLDEFRALKPQHRISEEERRRWWPKAKTLYVYEFGLLESYDPPLKARDIPRGVQTFIQQVEIEPKEALYEEKGIDSEVDAMIDAAPNYPSDVFRDLVTFSDQLPELIVWIPEFISIAAIEDSYSLKARAGWEDGLLRIKERFDSDFMRLLEGLMSPLQRRLCFHASFYGPNWTFLPLYDLALVRHRDFAETSLAEDWDIPIPNQLIWIPDFLSPTGSSVYARGREPNDLDVVFRAQDTGDGILLGIDKALVLKIQRILCRPLHWNSPEFQGLEHAPLWNLCLIRKLVLEPQIVNEAEFASYVYRDTSTRAERRLRAGTPEIRAQAEESLKKDSVTPKRAFFSLKPIRGAEAGKHMTLDSFFGLVQEGDFPMWSSTKRDGVTCMFAKEGDWVRVLSDDGEDLTSRMSHLIEQFKQIKPDKLVFCTEVEAWKGSQHYPREKAAGILHSGKGTEELTVQIFDCVYYGDQGDIHQLGFGERYALFSKLSLKGASDFKFIRHRRALTMPSLRRIAVEDIKANGSEGCVVKRDEAPYSLTGEPGRTRSAFKYHKSASVRGAVLGAIKTKKGAWIHRYGLLPGDLKPRKTETVQGKTYAVVGKTFARDTRFPLGSTIEVECETLNETHRADGTIEVTLWVPNLIQGIEGAPMTLKEAIDEGRRCGVLQVKEVDAQNKVTYLPTKPAQVIKDYEEWWSGNEPELGESLIRLEASESFDSEPVPVSTRTDLFGILKDAPIGSVEKAQKLPSEEGTYKYVIQHHWRGRSLHSDLRCEFNSLLVGWTLLDQIEGQTKTPVETLKQAKEEDARNIFKIDWKKGEIKKREIRGGIIRRAQIRVVGKAREIPSDWLSVEGVTERTEPGERPPAGATRKFPGVFHIIDRGTVEYGAWKPWFIELWLSKGKLRAGRWLIRLIERSKVKDAELWPDGELLALWDSFSSEEIEGGGWIVGQELAERGLIFKAEILPPGKEEERPRGPSFWTLIQPEEAERWSPYVLSKRAIDEAWLPPRGISALPKEIRKKVPDNLKYWTMSRKKALEARRELSEVEELGGPGKLRKDVEAIEKLVLSQFRSEGVDEDLKNPKTRWRELLADLRYLGNSAWPRLKRGEKWGDWEKEDVLKYFAKIVDTLRSIFFPIEEKKDESSYWDCYHAAKKYMKSEPPKPEEVSEWDEKRRRFLRKADPDLQIKVEAKPFKLQFHSWRGQIVIRFGRSDWHWDLRIQEDGSLWHLVLNEQGDDPLKAESVVGYEKPCRTDAKAQIGKWEGFHFSPEGSARIMDIRGEVGLKPGTEENPTKETPAWLESVDSGRATLLGEGPDWRKYRFQGKKLKGTYVFSKERGTKFWKMEKSGGPEVKEISEGISLGEWPGISERILRAKPYKPEKWPMEKCKQRDCDRPADIEVVWADGRGISQFCRSCYLDWIEEEGGGDPETLEIVRAYIREESKDSEPIVTVKCPACGYETKSLDSNPLCPECWAPLEPIVKTALSSLTESTIHRAFTVLADKLFALGYLNRDERIALSNLIGDTLDEFGKRFQEKLESGELKDPNIGNEDILQLLANGVKGVLTEMEPRPQEEVLAKESVEDYNNPRSVFFNVKEADGTDRWVAISSTSILDKTGEIVSRISLDRGIAKLSGERDKGPLLFWHTPWLRLGDCDFQARDSICLVESGRWGNDPMAQAAKKTIDEHPDEWGISIGFKDEFREDNVKEGTRFIKTIYWDLTFQERSVLPQWASCAHFTAIRTKEAFDMAMKATQEQALRELIGDELAEQVLAQASKIEQTALSEGLVVKAQIPPDPAAQGKAKPEDEEEEEEEKKAKPEDEEEEEEEKAKPEDEEEEEEEKKAPPCPEEEEEEEEKAARFAARLMDLVKKIEDPGLRQQFEKLVSELRESYPSPEKAEGGLIGAIQQQLQSLHGKVSGDTQKLVDQIIKLAGQLRGYGRYSPKYAYPKYPYYPQPKKEEEEVPDPFQLLGMGLKALHSAVEELRGQVKQLSEKKVTEAATETVTEEVPEAKTGEITLKSVQKELVELRTLVEEKSAPIRKSAVPSDEDEKSGTEGPQKKGVVLADLSLKELRSFIRKGITIVAAEE